MFADVDETLRALLVADLPVTNGEIDISFERPSREWSNRLTKPTLNLFLYDIRERLDLRDPIPAVKRIDNAVVTKRTPSRRIDMSYMITAWAREPADEHRILSRALASMLRRAKVEEEFVQGELRELEYPVLTRVMAPDHHTKPYELWGVLDNELRASHAWVITAPLNIFAPVATPIVRTREAVVRDRDETREERSLQVGGFAHRSGDQLAGVGGVRVSLKGTRHSVFTDEEGRFTFSGVAPGEYVLVAEAPGAAALERKIDVPSPTYDVSV